MHLGQVVTYVDAQGASSSASVLAIPDTGASGFKILDLSTAEAVPHRNDAVPGSAFWLLGDEPHDERRAPIEAQPVALAAAEDAGTLPEIDRRNDENDEG